MEKLSLLIADFDKINARRELAAKAVALDNLRSIADELVAGGLTDGSFLLEEDSETFELSCTPLAEDGSMSDDARFLGYGEKVSAATDLRVFSDTLAIAGHIHSAGVRVNLATFRADFIVPLERQLAHLGVDVSG